MFVCIIYVKGRKNKMDNIRDEALSKMFAKGRKIMTNLIEAINWLLEHLYPVLGAFIALVGTGVAAAIIGVVIGSIILAML